MMFCVTWHVTSQNRQTKVSLPPFEGWLDAMGASEHLARVLQSDALKGSPNLRRMLQYIGSRSLDGRSAELKEYTIGVEALDRPADFDPKADTIVRVQIHRLREKLIRYYEAEGRSDEIGLSIPRGQYSVHFSPRLIDPHEMENGNGPAEPPKSAPETKPSLPRLPWLFLAAGAVLTAILCGFLIGRWSANRASTDGSGRDPVVKQLWLSFLDGDKDPIIGYPDAVFLLDESNDLLRYRTGALSERGSVVEPHLAEEFASNPDLVRRAGPLFYEDGYTGTGELESAAMLVALFRDLGVRAHLKRSRDITIEDFQTHNAILLGSSFQNKAVRELPLKGDFQFLAAGLRHEIWTGSIVNRAPKAGEEREFRTERDSATGALRVDHAIISFQPGFAGGKHIAILGGLDTAGTACATQFATSPEGAATLLKGEDRSHGQGGAVQSIVRCTLNDGHSVSSARAVATHPSEWHEQQ